MSDVNDTPTRPIDGIWLDSFLVSIAESVASARRILRDQHLADLEHHSQRIPDKAGDPTEDSTQYRAETVRLEIERMVENAADGIPSPQSFTLSAPSAALIQPTPLILDSTTLEIECTITEVCATEEEGRDRIRICLDKSGAGGAPARLTVQFKEGTLSEGVAKIGEVLAGSVGVSPTPPRS